MKAWYISKRNGFVEEQQTILNVLAVAFTLNANYDRALEYHFQALVLRERSGDDHMITETLNNIGLVYFKMRNYRKALEFYDLALSRDYRVELSSIRDRLLVNIGLCHNQINNFQEAKKLFNDAMDYCQPNCSDGIRITAEFGLGVAYYGQKMFAESKNHFLRSLEVSKRVNDKRFKAENLIYLAHIDVFLQQYDSALILLNACEKIAKESKYNELLIGAYKEYSNIYNGSKNNRNEMLQADD